MLTNQEYKIFPFEFPTNQEELNLQMLSFFSGLCKELSNNVYDKNYFNLKCKASEGKLLFIIENTETIKTNLKEAILTIMVKIKPSLNLESNTAILYVDFTYDINSESIKDLTGKINLNSFSSIYYLRNSDDTTVLDNAYSFTNSDIYFADIFSKVKDYAKYANTSLTTSLKFI